MICSNCGTEFEAKRGDAKYCSGKCRKAAARIPAAPLLGKPIAEPVIVNLADVESIRPEPVTIGQSLADATARLGVSPPDGNPVEGGAALDLTVEPEGMNVLESALWLWLKEPTYGAGPFGWDEARARDYFSRRDSTKANEYGPAYKRLLAEQKSGKKREMPDGIAPDGAPYDMPGLPYMEGFRRLVHRDLYVRA